MYLKMRTAEAGYDGSDFYTQRVYILRCYDAQENIEKNKRFTRASPDVQ